MTHEEFFLGKDWWVNTEEFIYEGLLRLVDSSKAINVSKKFRSRYIDMNYWGIFPDTIPTLIKLKDKGYRLFILSNHVPEAKEIISNLGISEYMERIFISADMGVEKPNPVIYQMALSNHSPEDINIMIGDNYEADIEGALNGGFKYAIMVRKENEYNYKSYTRFLDGVIDIIEDIIDENR